MWSLSKATWLLRPLLMPVKQMLLYTVLAATRCRMAYAEHEVGDSTGSAMPTLYWVCDAISLKWESYWVAMPAA